MPRGASPCLGENTNHIYAKCYEDFLRVYRDARATLATYDSIRSSKKPVQFKGDKTAWLLCRIKVPVAVASKSEGKKKKKKATFKHKDYILCVMCSRSISEIDTEYLHAVQKFAVMVLQNIETRKQKAQIRTEALHIIEEVCRNWKDYVDCREEFFEEVCDAINSCYMSANVYLGQLHARAQELEYTYASKFSKMKGKKLLRSAPDGVSFRAIDQFTHVACTKFNYETIRDLHHFGNPSSLDYPFVVVPLAAYLDAPLGVLAADACEDMTEEDDASGNANEIVSFFYSVAGQVGRPIKSFLVYDSVDELYHIQEHAKSHWEGFRGIKNVLSKLLPYVGCITEVEISCPPAIQEDTRTTSFGMVLIIRLIEATCTLPSVLSPSVVLQWRGMPIFTCSCGAAELTDDKTAPVCIIRIPHDVKYTDVELRILLRGQVNAVSRDVGRKIIGFHDMTNSGPMLYEHDLQCVYTPLPDVHAGTVQFVSKLYTETDVVRLIFQKISCSKVLGTESEVVDDICVDAYCVVRWKGVEIARTEPARNTLSPVWRDLNIVVNPTPKDVLEGSPLLSIEVWDNDALDRGVLLGMKQFSVLELKEYGSSRTWFLESVVDDPVRKDLKIRKKTGAELQFLMSLVCANDITDEVARAELAIPFLSSAVKATKSKGDVGENGDDDNVVKARECVLQVHGIKNLKMYLLDVFGDAASDRPSRNVIPMMNPYCVFYFNGDEIGRTSASRLKGLEALSSPNQTTTEVQAVLPSDAGELEEKSERRDSTIYPENKEGPIQLIHTPDAEYLWNEEVIHINIPNAVELDACSLRVDVYVQDALQKSILFGSIIVSEKSFTSLLCSTSVRKKWYDVLSLSKIAGGPYMCGEILLSGRPASLKVQDDVEYDLTTALSPPLSIRSSEYKVDAAFWTSVQAMRSGQLYSFEVNWNGFPVISNDIMPDNIRDEDGFVSLNIPDVECTHFNRPHDILMDDSNIRVDLLAQSASGDRQRVVLARGVLGGASLVDYMAQPLRRTLTCSLYANDKQVDSTKWNEVTSGSGEKVASLVLNLGPAGEDDTVETDGRILWLDILGASGLVSPAHTENRRPNAFCKVFWNEEFVGQTAIAWNSTDPMWTLHRLHLPVPLIDIVDEALELCIVRIEVWNVASKSQNSTMDFLGCLEINGEELKQVVTIITPRSRWHALEMHPSMPTDQQEYVCSRNGAVKLRLAYGSRVVNEKCGEDPKGGEHFIRVNAAMTLRQVDNFTKTNAFVIVYWNDNEVGRTEVIEKELNPVFSDEVFLLRVPSEEYLRDQKLQVHVYDFSGGSTGDFLGQSLIIEGEQLIHFLRDTFDNSHVFPLHPDPELTDDENKYVGGSVSLSFKEVIVADVNDPVVLYTDAYINIVSAADITISNYFDQCADPTCVLYWYSLFDSPIEREIGRTEPMWKTTNPVWKPNRIGVKVPVIDEWSSIYVRIDVLDIASPTEVTFLGSCTLSGWSLKKVLDRQASTVNDVVSFTLDNVIRFHDSVKHTISYAPKHIPEVDVSPRGTLQVAGGAMSAEEAASIDGNDSVANARSIGAGEEKKDGDSRSIVSKKSENTLGTVETDKKNERAAYGNKIDIRIQSINSLTIPIELESVDKMRSEYIYFVARFNDKEVKKMFVKGEEKVSIDILNISYATGDSVSFIFFLPVDNDPSTCTMEIEIWISEDVLHNSEGQSDNDLFLGYVDLQGADLVQLLRPKAGEKTFPLKGRLKGEVRSSINRYVRGSSITIRGRVPDLVRTLSSKKISKGMSSTSNWRNSSQMSLKLPSMSETVDPLLKKESFQIHVCEAGGLSKIGGLMGGNSDIYAEVYWRGLLLGTTERMKSQASTIVSKDGSPTCEVVWENEVFILTKPEGERITECSLTIEIHEKKSLGGSVFLGCVTWEEDLLLEFLHSKEPSWHKLVAAYSKPKEEQKRVQGKLFIGAKCLDDSVVSGVKAGGWEFDTSVPLQDDMKDMEFSVLAAFGLGKADKFGKSDPFCIVKWNGVEIGKSEVVKKNLDPVWEEANFVIRTPKNLGPLAEGTSKGRSTDKMLAKRPSLVAPVGMSGSIDLPPVRGRDRRRAAMPITAVTQSSLTSRTDCELCVEVWDWNASGNSVFLGCVELKGPELASFMDEKEMKRKSFALATTKKLPKGSQKLVKGSIEFFLAPLATEKEAFAGRDFVLEISAARSLRKAERFGLADPYCIVRWNHRVVGKTNVVKNSLNPLWRNETFQVRTRGADTLPLCILYIEVWDKNLSGQGNFLGCVELSGEFLGRLVEINDFEWNELKPSPYLSKSVQTLKPTGELQIRLGMSGASSIAAANVATFELSVVCAENIAPASFFGDVDSFCVIKNNGREIGSTAVIPKNNSPKWSGERFVVTMPIRQDPDTGETSSTTVLTIEMWSMLALGRGDFLGGVTLYYDDLVRLAEDCLSAKRTSFTWSALQKSAALPDSKQKHIQGRIRLGCKNFGSATEDEIGVSGGSEVKLQWPTPPPTVPGTSIGLPSFELCILSCTDLVVPTKGKKDIVPDPFCLVYVNGEETGMTNICPGSCNPNWSDEEKISIRVPENVDQQAFSVSMEVYNMDGISKGEFLGRVVFSFWSLFCLQNGTFTFHMTPHLDDPDQYIKSTITFSLELYQPRWCSIRAYESPGIERFLSVLSGNGLPDVNGSPPTTRVTIVVEGAIRARSSTVLTSAQPTWPSPASCELSLDYRKLVKVVLQVLFIDAADNREICIGEVVIPNEFLLRPPVDSFELWLTPPTKKPPKTFEFIVDGSLTISLTGGGPNSETLWTPWSVRSEKPLMGYEVEEVSEVAQSSLYVGKEKRLTAEQCEWIGSGTLFTSAHVLSTRKEWLLLPLRGMGLIVDHQSVGTHPLKQYSICIERSTAKLTRSDAVMLTELQEALQTCLINLQRRDIYRYIRNRSLDRLKIYFENMIRNNTFSLNSVFSRIARIMKISFPGATFFISLVSKDFSHMKYCIYDSSMDTDDDPLFFTLWDGQGLEWECVGRDSFRRYICDVKGLKPERLDHVIPISFCRFQQFRAPRICSPLRSGDAAMGVLGLENFDILKAGAYADLVDLEDIKQWLSTAADLCGDVIYSGREKKVLKFLESYVLFSSSSSKGLIRITLEHVLSVLQGCRLMEIWSHDNGVLKSVATSWPESMPPPSRWVILKDIRVHFVLKESNEKKTNIVSDAMANFFFRKKKADVAATKSIASGESAAQVEEEQVHRGTPCGYILGIYYGGFEQYQYIPYFTTKKETEETFDHTFRDIKLFLANDRNISICLYCVDEKLTILDQFAGLFQLVTLKEKSASVQMMRGVKSANHFLFTSSVAWPSASTKAAQRSVALKALKTVDKFTLHIHRAYGLTKTDLVGSSDPFCEIYWCDKLIGKTLVVQDNLDPEWEEVFDLPAIEEEGADYTCRIEVWDMGFLGKDSFLGEFEIQLDQLLLPPVSDIEVQLQPKSTFTKAKNSNVGGSLVISHSVEKKESLEQGPSSSVDHVSDSDDESEDNHKGGKYPLSALERRTIEKFLDLEDPVIRLTVDRAEGLGKADLLGQSDPYVKVYRIDDTQRDRDCDPVAVTRVIDSNLNPVWNEDLIVALNIASKRNQESDKGGGMSRGRDKKKSGDQKAVGLLDDWPILILEVWDKDNVGEGTFLGEITLTPPQYALSRTHHQDLCKSKERNEKQNKIVKGSIYLKFAIQENTEKSSFQKFFFGPNRTLHLSTLVHINVVSAKNVAKITKGFKKKVINPYCILRWKKDKIGETAYKKNSVDPTWANEKFTFDISQALVDFKWADLTIEMWSKQGDVMDEAINFLGEIKVSFLDLLHPSQGATVKKELQTKPNAESGAGPVLTGGILTIRISRSHMPQRVPVKYKDVRTFPMDIRSQENSGNIESQYSNERVKVVTSDPIPLEMVLDPEAERRRQRFERLELPQLLSKYDALNDRYLQSPFDQIGLISELHYGQTINAFEKNVSTVLHVGDGDIHLMPALVPKIDMSSEIASYESEFVQAAGSFDDEGDDLMQDPPKEEIKVKREGDMCLVCRYPKAMIPRRDMTFLTSLRDTMIKSLTLFEQREKRIREREIVLDKITQMHANSKRYTLEDIILTALHDVGCLFNCEVDIYLLQSGGVSAHERIYLLPCSLETGFIDDNVMPGDVSEFVKMCAKVCRHNILLQCYRGDCMALGMDWRKEFSQSSVVSLESISDDISVVEGRGLCHNLREEALTSAGMGACAIPLMLGSEVMLGVMILSGTDKLPHSIYRREKREDMKGNLPDHAKSHAVGRIGEDDIEMCEMFEEGTSECMRDLGVILGLGIFTANMDAAIKDVKTFPVRDGTDPEDVIRYTFRRLLEAVPMLVEISIWKVWVIPESDNKVVLGKDVEAAPEKKPTGGMFSMFRKRAVAEMEELPEETPTVVDGVFEMLEKQATLQEETMAAKVAEINAERVMIEAGFFSSEAGTEILTTGNEKILYQQLYEIDTDGPPASASGRRQSLLSNEKKRRKSKSMQEKQQKHRVGITSAGAQVQFAISRHEYSRVVPWVTDIPSSLKKEAFAAISSIRKEFGRGASDSDQSSLSSNSESDQSDAGSDKGGIENGNEEASAAGKSVGDSDSLVSKGEKNDVVKSLSIKRRPPASLSKKSSFFGKTASKMKFGSKVFGSISSVFVDHGDVSSLTSSLVEMEDPCIVAHKEICRCVDTLGLKSFHLGTGGGIYLSMIERKPDGVVDKIFTKRFLQPASENIEILTKSDVSESVDDEDNSEKAVNVVGNTDSDAKKKTRRGSSNVKTGDSMVPRSQSKGPLPQIAAPPPPKAPRPDKKGDSNKLAKDIKKNDQASTKKGGGAAKIASATEKASKESRYEYFLQVKTDGKSQAYSLPRIRTIFNVCGASSIGSAGVGGEMGWGVIGDTLSTQIDTLVQTMHFVLAKVVAAKIKVGKVYILF